MTRGQRCSRETPKTAKKMGTVPDYGSLVSRCSTIVTSIWLVSKTFSAGVSKAESRAIATP